MEIIFKGEKHKTLMFIDTEFEGERIIQFSGLVFIYKQPNIYELNSSFNLYLNDHIELSKFTTDFTGISNDFIEKYGIDDKYLNRFWKEITSNYEDIMIIGHDMHNDLHVLFKNGVNIDQYDYYDTYQKAKHYWTKEESYTVQALAGAQGFFLYSPHDSFSDAWGLIPIFAELKEIELNNRKD